ncbi:hypothetical protein [Lentzea terrae]|uniref:hypothetical protein n=1 Tax=Lentzea terrae TaxID=2200761 RepID=UPI001300250C|nr:hypothetical protein [Lentzea terrae]
MLRFRATRAMAVVAAAAVLTAGCATGPGLAKHHSPRRTVQAGADASSTDPSAKPSAQPNKPVDPAFAAERMRLVNPCALIDKDVLQTVGTPSKYSSSYYTRCSNYMKDKAGKNLGITLDVGYTLTSSDLKNATKQLAGLKSGEQKLTSSCFITVVTQENPAQALRVQVTTGTGDQAAEPCEPGRKVLEGAVRKARGNPQKYTPPKGSPVELDPCTVVDKATLAPVLGASPRSLPFGLHKCSWYAQNGQMELEFKTARIPKDGKFDPKSVEVDLGGGVKGYQVLKEGPFPTCDLIVVRTKDSSDAGEVAEFSIGAQKENQLDRCQATQAFAKAVLPSLPSA